MLTKRILNKDMGRGSALFDGAGVDQFVHSSGVVVEGDGLKFIYCSGVTATLNSSSDPAERDTIVGSDDIGAQTRQVLENLRQVLKLENASMDDIVRVRVYVKAPMTRQMFHRIHEVRSEYFTHDHFPASTLVVVAGLVRPEALIEIDADALVRLPKTADETPGA